ncbi:reverse transcriptase family protein [Acanthopleuribacter pedis]|uniref:RNA-directed DNA polymerase n=1 Tax=Acanthopleuribacter pedis TaxID=442870 RepID=A0A8J7U3X6_9BACT|nr:reverse transcriptase family protein [Acanthopleuribacter pedis]MBO1319229.1 RNA-directed DNA polymerase [Acanthopleuribacter pedis]
MGEREKPGARQGAGTPSLEDREQECRAIEQAALAALDRDLAEKRLDEGLKREHWYEHLIAARPRRGKRRFPWKRNRKPRPVFSAEEHRVKFDCPPLPRLEDVAHLLDIPLAELQFLAFGDRRLEISHYRRFAISKKSGGQRQIAAPMPRLKRVQRMLYEQLFQQIPLHPVCMGFRPGRSIVDNARPHVGADVVVNLDLQNFFPGIPYARVRGFLRAMGYNAAVATCLARLVTEPSVSRLQWRGRSFTVETGPRRLPQGAPTSPAVANAIAYRLDCRLMGLAKAMGWRYSRYADDLSFSAVGEPAFVVGDLLARVRSIIGEEGFTVHPDKTRIQRKGRRQEVTGLVVNRVVSVPRDELRRFRALLHQIERSGFEGKQWGRGGDLHAAIEGYLNYLAMVDEIRAEPYKKQWRRIKGAATD